MNIYVVSPNYHRLLTPAMQKQLHGAGRLTVAPTLEEVSRKILNDKQEKVIALDPDSCNWQVPNELLAQLQQVKGICLQTTSFSWIDTGLARKNGIPVVNIRGFSTQAVAEWALLMAHNVARKVPLLIKNGWEQDYDKYRGQELKGKVAAIIGMGAIGTQIAELCQAAGMRVVYWSQQTRDDRFFYMPLARLMKTADVIFPAVAQNKKTAGLLTDKHLKSMKKSAIFISIVHTIYNHELLLEMVKREQVFGYGFEVDGGGDFGKYSGNVWAGPALAWVTENSWQRNAQGWVNNILATVKGTPVSLVN